MRPVWQTAPALSMIVVASMLAPSAFRHDYYATTTLLLLAIATSSAGILWRFSELARRQKRIEVSNVRPADREKYRNRALLDHAPVPLLYQTGDGAFHAANRAARRLFRTEDRLRDPPRSLNDAVMAGLDPERRVLRLATDNAIPRSYALSTASGSGIGGIAQFIALTDIDAELNAANAEVLREMLQILSHEIMNSLTPVISLAETAHDLAQAASDEETRNVVIGALDTILRRAKGLNRFIQGYRRLARLPSPERQRISLDEIFQNASGLFEARWGARVMLEIDQPTTRIMMRIDPVQLEHALMNLLNNAAEAALTGTAAQAHVWLHGDGSSSGLHIAVRDNGDGIAPEHHETIFRPFFSLKAGGNGIGLSLARQIVLAHGGTLTLDAPMPDRPWRTSFSMRL